MSYWQFVDNRSGDPTGKTAQSESLEKQIWHNGILDYDLIIVLFLVFPRISLVLKLATTWMTMPAKNIVFVFFNVLVSIKI